MLVKLEFAKNPFDFDYSLPGNVHSYGGKNLAKLKMSEYILYFNISFFFFAALSICILVYHWKSKLEMCFHEQIKNHKLKTRPLLYGISV